MLPATRRAPASTWSWDDVPGGSTSRCGTTGWASGPTPTSRQDGASASAACRSAPCCWVAPAGSRAGWGPAPPSASGCRSAMGVRKLPAEPPIRVLVVDDHPMVREGLRSMLTADGVEVVGEAASGADALRDVLETSPDVVLLDLELPDL